jgi:exodeoxyribonuclease V beta subunit
MNALYVAMTRAVQSLCVVAKSKSSWFEPLGLTQGCWGEKKFELHTPQEPTPLRPIEYQGLSYGKQSHDESNDDEVKDLDFEAIEYGLALHYGLEMLETFEPSSVDNALECVRKKYGITLGEGKLEMIKSSLNSVIVDEQFQQLTLGKIYKEQSFLYNQAMGVIDVLVEHHEGYWVVVDYKSGEARTDDYTSQVLRYMDAVAGLTQCEVRGYLCYVGQHQCQWRKVER